jgi:hypothetical protein
MGGTKTVAGFWLAHCFGKKELMGEVLVELFALISSGVSIVFLAKESYAVIDSNIDPNIDPNDVRQQHFIVTCVLLSSQEKGNEPID